MESIEKALKIGKRELSEYSSKDTVHATTFRFAGARKKVKDDAVDRGVVDFFRDCRTPKPHISR